jgi:hypothetical protein
MVVTLSKPVLFAHNGLLRERGNPMSPTSGVTMGRKKGGPRMSAVKIETEAVRKAKLIAAARGQTLAEYLSKVATEAVARDFPKVWKEMAKEHEPKRGEQ